jgi:16S rRNA (cytidine1402-2'-O)-methyltransferase
VNGQELKGSFGLFIVATPIGNLEDITLRAIRILKDCDCILSEDTRKTSILLKHYDITTPQKSYRVHKIAEDTKYALELLKQGKNLALCTDAGTPGISDPGSYLVRAVRENLPEIPIIPIPGPSAMTAAMSISGFQANPSLFLGFLSPKPGKRRKVLTQFSNFEGCLVIFESVHRILRLIADIMEIFPDRDIFIAREITKFYEETIWIPAKGEMPPITEKGEFVVIISPVR